MLSQPSTANHAPLDAEADVVARLKAGDREAVGLLYEWFAARLFGGVILPRLPVREMAEDVLKDTFVVALEKIGQYQPGAVSIFYWLRRIALNRIHDIERRLQRVESGHKKVLEEQVPGLLMAEQTGNQDRWEEYEHAREMVETSLSRIPPRYAEALRLRLIDELSPARCAEVLGISVSTFHTLLYRACKAFREAYPP